MTNDQIDDLKLFMATTIHNEVENAVETKVRTVVKEEVRAVVKEEVRAVVKEEVRAVVKEEVRAVVKEEVRAIVQEELVPVRQEIHDLAAFMQDALGDSNEVNQQQLDDHERRIARLEAKAA